MATTLRAVAFDLGGTLEDLYYDDAIRREATRGLQRLLRERGLDPCLPLPELQAAVLSGMKAYQDWRERLEVELPPERVWTEFVFPNHGLPRNRLMAEAEDITFYYETHFHIRTLRPEAPAALAALCQQGFRLAVISNIISRRMVQVKLEEYGIAHHFDPVMTSSNFGWRKPNERIFLETARLMDLSPTECAYVGDTVSRDVSGARRSGYGFAIQIKSFLTNKADKETDIEPPDAIIHDLMQVVGLIAQENQKRETKDKQRK